MVRRCDNCDTEETKCWRNINKSWYCNPCGLYFKRKQKHKEKNGDKKITEHEFDSFECKECNKVYSQICSLRKHCKDTHLGKGAEKYSNVVSKTHSVTLDFQCPNCEVCCKSHFGLKRHLTKNHEQDENMTIFYQLPLVCLKENSDLFQNENYEEILVSLIKERIKEIKFNQKLKLNTKWSLNEINKMYSLLKIKEKNEYEEIMKNFKLKSLNEVLQFSFSIFDKMLNLLKLKKKRKNEFMDEMSSKQSFLDELDKLFNDELISIESFDFNTFEEVRF
eukprot:gene4671-8243_t